jgi:hypothetical protein
MAGNRFNQWGRVPKKDAPLVFYLRKGGVHWPFIETRAGLARIICWDLLKQVQAAERASSTSKNRICIIRGLEITKLISIDNQH